MNIMLSRHTFKSICLFMHRFSAFRVIIGPTANIDCFLVKVAHTLACKIENFVMLVHAAGNECTSPFILMYMAKHTFFSPPTNVKKGTWRFYLILN